MAGTRNAPSKAKHYAWSNLYLGGESELRQDRKIVTKQNIVSVGSEVSADDLGLSDEEFQAYKDEGVIREYPHPEGYLDEDGNLSEAASGQSPYTFVLEQRRAELEAAESDADAEAPEDMLLRAALAHVQPEGPKPEEVLLGNEPALPAAVEEPPAEPDKPASKS